MFQAEWLIEILCLYITQRQKCLQIIVKDNNAIWAFRGKKWQDLFYVYFLIIELRIIWTEIWQVNPVLKPGIAELHLHRSSAVKAACKMETMQNIPWKMLDTSARFSLFVLYNWKPDEIVRFHKIRVKERGRKRNKNL